MQQNDLFGPSPHRPPGAREQSRFVDIVPSCGHSRTIQVLPTRTAPLTNAQICAKWAQRLCYACTRKNRST